MREIRTSGLMSGNWKRRARSDIQTPTTERVGNSYGLNLNSTAPILDSTPLLLGALLHLDRRSLRNELAKHEGVPICEPDAAMAFVPADPIWRRRSMHATLGRLRAIHTMPTGFLGPGGN